MTGGGDLSTNRTITLGNTGSAGTYGSSTAIPVFNTDAQGRVTSVTNTSAALDANQITTGILSVTRGGTGLGAAPSNGQLLIGNGTGFTETTLTPGTGILITNGVGSITTLIDNSVVATISGSTFTGAVKFNSGLSGSLTQLTDGTSYLIASSNMSVTSASNGAITLKATPSGLDTYVQFNDDGTTFGANSGLAYNKTTQALTGTIIRATNGFSGSLTKLTNGTSYLIASSSMSITTGSNGAVTFRATPGGVNTEIQFNNNFSGSNLLTWDGSTLVVSGAIRSTGAVAADGGVLGDVTFPPGPIQTIVADATTITVSTSYHRLSATNNYTISNTPCISYPTATTGSILFLQVVLGSAGSVTLNKGTLQRLALSANTRKINSGGSIQFSSFMMEQIGLRCSSTPQQVHDITTIF